MPIVMNLIERVFVGFVGNEPAGITPAGGVADYYVMKPPALAEKPKMSITSAENAHSAHAAGHRTRNLCRLRPYTHQPADATRFHA